MARMIVNRILFCLVIMNLFMVLTVYVLSTLRPLREG